MSLLTDHPPSVNLPDPFDAKESGPSSKFGSSLQTSPVRKNGDIPGLPIPIMVIRIITNLVHAARSFMPRSDSGRTYYSRPMTRV